MKRFEQDVSRYQLSCIPLFSCIYPVLALLVETPNAVIHWNQKGIKPANVQSVLEATHKACSASAGNEFWIDMESGVRTTVLRVDEDGNEVKDDIFDLDKCYRCIDTVCEAGFMNHPPELR